MAAYIYECPTHGEIEVNFPMGTAPQEIQCPQRELYPIGKNNDRVERDCSYKANKKIIPLHFRRPSKTTDSSDPHTRFQFEHLNTD